MPIGEVPFRDGMKYGLGYNALTGLSMSSPAAEGTVSEPEEAKGQLVTSSCVTVQSVENLHKTLGIEVGASGSYGPIKGDAKVEYAQSCDFSSFSTYVIVRVTVRNAFRSIDSPKFTQDAEDLIKNENNVRFRERFGDGYIHGIKTGGEYFAIYQLTSTSLSERESLSVSVKAAYDGVITKAALSTAISTAKSQSVSNLQVQVYVYRQGTIQDADLDVVDIMETAKTFPVDVAGENAFAYSALVQDYRTLKSPKDDFNYLEIGRQEGVLADFARKRFQLLESKDDFSYMLKYPTSFQNLDGSDVSTIELEEKRADLIDDLNKLEGDAITCSKDPTKCEYTKISPEKYDEGKPIPKAAPPPINAMPDLVGLPAGPVLSFIACLQMEEVEHCVNFLGPELNPIRNRLKELGEFFFHVFRDGVRGKVDGNPNPPGTTIREQFPAKGTPVTHGAQIVFYV
ncbi:hypothetical protein [Prescottella agglutinans]|uniref:Uncharacterized protein n=1 Tax=Prescottella agglutinans TaxID=1644129 RepID=A0ABT6MI81_9NOCA|nr:hypothetical protein [Prescottella agglutinans]MDH6284041.1 hypothetical protein [Prescottella agglutinans]